MGYSLYPHALRWSDLGSALGSGDRALLSAASRGPGARLFAGPAGIQPSCERALAALVDGDLGRQLALRGPLPPGPEEEVAPEVALAFTAIVETMGTRLGELVHNTRAGRKFRGDFIGRGARFALTSSVDPALLIERPLFGVTYPGYPSWGGLTLREAIDLAGATSVDALPRLEDSDHDEWLYALCTALEDARSAESDIVAVYY